MNVSWLRSFRYLSGGILSGGVIGISLSVLGPTFTKKSLNPEATGAGISVEKAKKFYGHNYYLSDKEQAKYEPTTEAEDENSDNSPVTKKAKSTENTTIQEKTTKKRSANDYEKQSKYVLPDRKVVTEYKHKKALQQEVSAAKALAAKDEKTKVTLHFDTTSRSRVDGEWPALILNFKSENNQEEKMIRLRPLFFAFENRDNIIRLVVETFERLSVAGGGVLSAAELWEQIYAYMTDSVSKNLEVEKGVSLTLGTEHVPIHILCKSHMCEKLDESCIDALVEVESQLKIAQMIIQKQPRLKSFLRKSRSVAVCAMNALLTLVSTEKSAKPTSLAKDFDLILEEDGVAKSFSLYVEKRFTKLGYTAGALVDCLPQFEKLLSRTHATNLLVRACRLYLESEYVVTALKSLANFTYKITMPFLNCVEKVDQGDLVEILPRLYKDLLDAKMETLADYHVPWTHVSMENQVPTSALDHYLLTKMCRNAALGVKMQCAREYWGDERNPRVTELYKLKKEELMNLPTENLVTERELAKFGYLASLSAARSNRNFKAESIRNNMFAVSQTEEDLQKSSDKIIKSLKSMEIKWTEDQKKKWKDKISENISKRQRTNAYADTILKRCKDHNGPITSLNELAQFVKKTPAKDLRKFIRQEVIFQRILHEKDGAERPDLYKVQNYTADQMIENLTILLEQPDGTDDDSVVEFPSIDEMMMLLTSAVPAEEPLFQLNEPLAVVWDEGSDDSRRWFVGIYLGDNEEDLRIDHLHGSGSEWKRPAVDDVQDHTKHHQIVPCKLKGHWEFGRRISIFKVDNVSEIDAAFLKYFM